MINKCLLDKISDIFIFEFKGTVITKRRAYFNVICCAILCFILSRIPLDTGTSFSSVTAFHVSNSWMHIGFRPYLWTYFLSYWIEKDKYKNGRLRALYLLLSLPFLIEKSWMTKCILFSVSLGLVQIDAWLSVRGLISLNSVMLLMVFCRDHCFRPMAWVCLLFIVCLNMTGVTLPMVHMKRRLQPQSAKLPLLYHEGGPLIMYVRVVELLAMFWSPIGYYLLTPPVSWLGIEVIKYGIIYILSRYWSKWYNKTGYDLAKKWNNQRFTLKGWRSATTMGKHIDHIIRRNIYWDVLFTCFQSFICVICSIRPASIWISLSTMRQIKDAAN